MNPIPAFCLRPDLKKRRKSEGGLKTEHYFPIKCPPYEQKDTLDKVVISTLAGVFDGIAQDGEVAEYLKGLALELKTNHRGAQAAPA